ncbi:MAG TPA: hypothetical protein VK213_07610 [Bacteroidales bacterium]|nr:hypothetical protein [Bacteroidales bacterium]
MGLKEKYPPSEPCTCDICRNYCSRPGWWTVEEAENVMAMGLASRMMLEISPDRSFGVLSPAFKGNESNISLEIFANEGCTFFAGGLCELSGTGLQPLECRYCHHSRKGLGKKCHSDIERDWNREEGKKLIVQWGKLTGLWARQGFYLTNKR